MNILSRAICLVAVSSTTVLAQSYAGTFTKGSPAAMSGMYKNNIGVGPYAGTLTSAGAPAQVQFDITSANSGFSFWCVDAAGIYQSDNSITVQTIGSLGAGALQTKLAKAAFVTTLYQGFAPAKTASNVSNFNAAIWNIMGATPAGFAPGDVSVMNGYIADAEAGYGSLDLNSFYYVQFDAAGYVPGGAQEVIFQGGGEPFISVPEPGTFALLSVGLFGIAAVRRRRATA